MWGLGFVVRGLRFGVGVLGSWVLGSEGLGFGVGGGVGFWGLGVRHLPLLFDPQHHISPLFCVPTVAGFRA